jgi:hypothetical protein
MGDGCRGTGVMDGGMAIWKEAYFLGILSIPW